MVIKMQQNYFKKVMLSLFIMLVLLLTGCVQRFTVQEIFPDEALAARIAAALNVPVDRRLGVQVKDNIVKLFLDGAGITNLEGMQHLSNLTTILLSDNNVSDLTPLRDLQKLEWLALNGNEIEDLEPLNNVKSLQLLELNNNQIHDVSALAELTNLARLELNNNQITNLEPLEELTSLTRLELNNNHIHDLTPLINLANSITISAHNQQIILPDAITGRATHFQLRDRNSGAVSLISSLGEFTFDNHYLTWHTAGEKRATWDVFARVSNIRFSGVVHQTVYEADAIVAELFPDESLAFAVARELDVNVNEEFDPQKLRDLHTLVADNFSTFPNQMKIQDLTGMEHLVGLEVARLSNNSINDLTPLASLVNLTSLDLANTQIDDVAPLASLVNLTSLDLANTQINDVEPLTSLVNLTSLDLANTQIDDVEPLASLVNLTSLDLANNQIDDVALLASLVNLTSLDLANNQINDVVPLAGLASLTSLQLDNNQISDLSPLRNLNLGANATFANQQVTLSAGIVNRVNEFVLKNINGEAVSLTSGVGGFNFVNGQLTWLSEGDNYATWDVETEVGDTRFSGVVRQTVSPVLDVIAELFPDESLAFAVARELGVDVNARIDVQNLNTLHAIYASDSGNFPNQRPIQNLAGVEHLVGLEHLHLNHSQISNLAPLASLPNLQALSLQFSQISSLTPLASSSNLRTLSLQFSQINDFASLASLTNLTSLSVANTQISDLTPLAGLTNLTNLALDSNQISDVTLLAGLTNLTRLTLDSNQISDLSPLKTLNLGPNSSFQNQTITLPDGVVNVATAFVLKDINGEAISLIPEVGDFNFANGELIWMSAGSNYATWDAPVGDGNVRFSGIVGQVVLPNQASADVVADSLASSILIPNSQDFKQGKSYSNVIKQQQSKTG